MFIKVGNLAFDTNDVECISFDDKIINICFYQDNNNEIALTKTQFDISELSQLELYFFVIELPKKEKCYISIDKILKIRQDFYRIYIVFKYSVLTLQKNNHDFNKIFTDIQKIKNKPKEIEPRLKNIEEILGFVPDSPEYEIVKSEFEKLRTLEH